MTALARPDAVAEWGASSGGRPTGRLVHEAMLYRTPEEYVGAVTTFVDAALTADEPVLVAAPAGTVDLITHRLGATAHRVRFADMTDIGRNPGRIIPFLLQAFIDEHPSRPVRVVGEPVWPERSGEEYIACVQHELLVNAALGDRPGTILCAYDVARLPAGAVADARRTHPYLVDGAGPTGVHRHRSTEYSTAALDHVLDRPLGPIPGPAVSFHFDVRALTALRRFVAAQASTAGLAPDRTEDLLLAVNELAANTIRYAGGKGTIDVWWTDRDLVCEVHDSGQITDPLVGRLSPPPDSAHGRGLLIVNHLCDLVRIHAVEGSTTVRIYFRR